MIEKICMFSTWRPQQSKSCFFLVNASKTDESRPLVGDCESFVIVYLREARQSNFRAYWCETFRHSADLRLTSYDISGAERGFVTMHRAERTFTITLVETLA